MQMKYLKDASGDVHGFDLDNEEQVNLMNQIAAGWEDVTGAWPPPPTPEQIRQMVGLAVDQMLDALARSWRYQDSTRLLAAKGSSNARYAAEGTTFEAYWSSCWALLDELEADVLAGTAQMPSTVDDVLALLPAPPVRPVVP